MTKINVTRAAASTRILGLLAVSAIAAGLLAFGITEEVPIGSIAGKVRLKENGKAIEGVDVYLSPKDEEENDPRRSYHFVTDKDGEFFRKSVPAGEYTLTASAKAHSFEAEKVSIKEGKPTDLEVAMKPAEPYLNVNASQKVFLPSEQPNFQIDGFLDKDAIHVEVFKLNLSSIVDKGSLRDVLEAFSRYADTKQDPAKYGTLSRTLDHKLVKLDAEGVFVETIALDPLPEGFYWVRCRSGKVDQGIYLNVSKIGLVSKTGLKQATCFVSSLDSGTPVENAAIAMADGNTLKQVGMTSPDGSLTFDLKSSEKHLIMAKYGNSVAVVNFYADSLESEGGRIYAYSDRPIYKPGDLIQFKGIVRKLVGNDFQAMRSGTVTGELRDPDDNLVQSFNLPISPRGTVSGKFSTNKEAKPGNYTFLLKGAGVSGRLYLDIAAYRKPEFEITVTPEQKSYVFGQKAKFKVKCEYYFGGPVVGTKVDAYVTRSPYWSWEDEEGNTYTDDSGSGEGTEDLTAVTDENGEATIEFDTKRPDEEPEYASDSDYLYSVSVSASEDEKYFEGAGSVRVTRGMFDTDISVSEYIGEKGTPVDLTVRAMSNDDKKPLPGKTFKILVGQESWSGDKVRFEPLATLSASTGSDGSGKVTYTPSVAGSIVFKAQIEDDAHNLIQATDYLYVEGAGVAASPGGKLMVTLDKPKYEVGDTAKALIQTDKPGGFALFTVEADEVLYRKVINLTQTVTIIPFGVEKPFAPNAQVSVVYIKDKQFFEASESLVLKLSEQKLKIDVTPDRERLMPGQQVTYTVKTTDQRGQPIAADLSVGVVDESIYALKSEQTDIFDGFFPRRATSVQTNYSFPDIYLDGGDKGGGKIAIRTKFLDTAYWNPNVHTDASGTARVSVTLPDNLTTWRTTVVGATDSTQVGMATSQVVASKPLMIRLETPSYLVAQDDQRISAIVQNDSGQPTDVVVRLQTKGLAIQGGAQQTVRVEPGHPKTVEWRATAQTTGTAELVATAEIQGGANDGVQHTIEIKPHGRELQEVQAGTAAAGSEFTMVVRDGADPNTGRLVLSLSPSIATTLVQSLDDLVQFPYGCVEQTMSRFLPAILVDRALTETGLSRPDLKAKIPAIAADGLTRLARMQHSDGGWGWWEYDDSDPFMTALVLDGLHRARVNGVDVNENVLARGLDWAVKRFGSKEGKSDRLRDKAYLAYALAANGRLAEARKVFKLEFLDAGPSELAFGALTCKLLGPDFNAQKDSLLGKLKSLAKVTPQTASWTANPYSWGEENTALALAALVELDPNSALIPKTVRYLMQARKGDYWSSTRDTAYVIIGMTAYLKQTHELENVSGSVTVNLNGKEIKRLSFSKDSLFQPDLRIEIPMKDLQPGKNTVQIQKQGSSICYYSADLKQVVPDEKLGQVMNNNDLKIDRAYFKMEPHRMEDGTMKLMRSSRTIDEVKSGDIIKVVLTVYSARDREYVLLEDPVPSNCRVTEREIPDEYEEWGWWWASTVIKEDRVAFFARELNSGQHEFTYIMRAEGNGMASALPARVGNMYDPEDFGSTSELRLKVNER